MARGRRDATIDVAKGMGIVLVVIGHSIALTDTRMQAILFSFRMPLFFFLSGLFLKPEIDRFLATRSQGLLKPYFVVAAGVAFLFWLKSVLLADHDLPMLASIGASKLAGVGYAVGTTLDNIPLWFLPGLFVAQLTALGLIASGLLRRPLPAFALIVALMALGFWVMKRFATPFDLELGPVRLLGVIGLPWSIDLALVTGAFVALGHCCRDRAIGFRPALVPVLACATAFAILHVAFPTVLDFNTRVGGAIPVVIGLALTGIYLALAIAWAIGRTGWPAAALSACGRASLFILLFHFLPQQEVYRALHEATGNVPLAGAVGLAAGVAVPLALRAVILRVWLFRSLLLPSPSPALR